MEQRNLQFDNSFFDKFDQSEQVEFVKELLIQLNQNQLSQINDSLTLMSQRDIISHLPSTFYFYLNKFCFDVNSKISVIN